ncbi:MAG: hypothetical protein QXS19_06995 [Candidatus Methanomethylicia archaeon]
MAHERDQDKLITMDLEYMNELHKSYGTSKYMSYLRKFITENEHRLYFVHLYDFDVDNPKVLDDILYEIKNKYFSDEIREDIVYDICLHYLDYIKNDNKFIVFVCNPPFNTNNPAFVSHEIDSADFFSKN